MEQMFLPILLFGGLGLMMYFGMRKQKRQVAQVQKMQQSLVPGTRVMTTSGLHGTITAVADDTIELEVAPGIRTTWVRAAVREVVVEVPPNDDVDEELTVVDGVVEPADDVLDESLDSGGESKNKKKRTKDVG